MKILFFILIFSNLSTAQSLPGEVKKPEEIVLPQDEVKPVDAPFEKAVENAKPVPEVAVTKTIPESKTKDFRRQSNGSVMIGYELLTTWIPSKKTISGTYIFNQDWSAELEYAWGSIGLPIVGIDVGSLSEKRYSLLAKRYFGNSFHLQFGPYFYDYEAHAGIKILNRMTQKSIADFGVEGLGAAFGLGNRWQWKSGMTLGIDWFRINVPLKTTQNDNKILKNIEDEGSNDDVKNVLGYFSRVPTFVLLGLNLGYTF